MVLRNKGAAVTTHLAAGVSGVYPSRRGLGFGVLVSCVRKLRFFLQTDLPRLSGAITCHELEFARDSGKIFIRHEKLM